MNYLSRVSTLNVLYIDFSQGGHSFGVYGQQTYRRARVYFFTRIDGGRPLPITIRRILFTSKVGYGSTTALYEFRGRVGLYVISWQLGVASALGHIFSYFFVSCATYARQCVRARALFCCTSRRLGLGFARGTSISFARSTIPRGV